MNERIQKIADQAGLEFDDDEAFEFGKQIYYVTKEGMEKFTELIVRECADIVANSSLPDAYSEPALENIAEEIKEHFGVSND